MVLSPDPDARRDPSLLYDTELTLPVCPDRVSLKISSLANDTTGVVGAYDNDGADVGRDDGTIVGSEVGRDEGTNVGAEVMDGIVDGRDAQTPKIVDSSFPKLSPPSRMVSLSYNIV